MECPFDLTACVFCEGSARKELLSSSLIVVDAAMERRFSLDVA